MVAKASKVPVPIDRRLTETLGAHLLVAKATLLTAAWPCPHAAQAGLGTVWRRERDRGESGPPPSGESPAPEEAWSGSGT